MLCGDVWRSIRPDTTRVDAKFLYYSFFGEEWRKTIAGHTLSGSTVDRVPLTNFRRLSFDSPLWRSSTRSPYILSAYDDLIENNSRRIAILEEMARALYREWFVSFGFRGMRWCGWWSRRWGRFRRGGRSQA